MRQIHKKGMLHEHKRTYKSRIHEQRDRQTVSNRQHRNTRSTDKQTDTNTETDRQRSTWTKKVGGRRGKGRASGRETI